jgi:sn-glycerol 3-phosphate transport system ATP-binding protein
MFKIELNNVCKAYDKNPAIIENLNLKIKEGSFTVLVGPSGCGKSTILRMIAGLEEETSGDIFINEINMKQVEPGDRDIAMVFQNYALYPTMTVKANIEFGLINHKIPKKEREERILEICNIVGISDYLMRKPSTLSGGQRQRVALARAMVKKPEVFLMDEPLSNLDAKLRSQLRTELIELHRRLETTFVYVTHDQVEAMSMGTDIVLLNEGKIMQKGTPIELYHHPKNLFSAEFIGTPPMNILTTEDKDSAYVGFRPEHGELFKTSQDDEGLMLEGTVVTHEMLGSEILYKIDTKQGRVNVKIFDLDHLYEGNIYIYVEKEKLCYFDENQVAIRKKENAYV